MFFVLAFILFPFSIASSALFYLWSLWPWAAPCESMTNKISDRIYHLCRSDQSISSAYGHNPTLAPGKLSSKLFGKTANTFSPPKPPSKRVPATAEDLQRAYECGKFGPTRPSDLFLRCYHDALLALQHDALNGTVSPSLMGSHGVVPLTIVGSMVDINRHISNLIARADREVFLATNYWMNSEGSLLIVDAIRELSRRVGERGTGEKAVVKIMYDRGHVKQFMDPHTIISPKEYTASAINMPPPHDIPHVDLQVMNFHRPLLGTFHCKFLVVDRKIAITQSNNIQSNDNCEMAVQLEGRIVHSIYDVALASWDKPLNPPLPCADASSIDKETFPTFSEKSFADLFDAKGNLKLSTAENGVISETRKTEHDAEGRQPEHTGQHAHFDVDVASEIARMQSTLSPRDGEKRMDRVAAHLNEATRINLQATAPECAPEEDFAPMIPHAIHEPFPIAMVNRKPWGPPNHQCVHVPQNEAWLSAVRNAQKTVFIQTPNLNADALLPELLAAIRRGVEVTYYVCLGYNDAGELLPYQGGTNEMISHKLYSALDEQDRKRLHVHFYVGKDQTHPIHNKFKQRSCHIKLLIVDSHLGIQGSGNQDTQSWYQSQEINIMIDSPLICQAWIEAIRRNQNTHLYGAVSQVDGIWRSQSGKEAEGSLGHRPGKMAWTTGIKSAIERMRDSAGL